MKRERRVKAFVEIAKEAGATVERVDFGKHAKLRCRCGDHRFTLVCPVTPSCPRAHKNFRSTARQMVRAN